MNIEELKICSICISYTGNNLVETNCNEINNKSSNHFFHEDCLNLWINFKKQNECPLCRTYFTKINNLDILREKVEKISSFENGVEINGITFKKDDDVKIFNSQREYTGKIKSIYISNNEISILFHNHTFANFQMLNYSIIRL
jgi:hypothetical protein